MSASPAPANGSTLHQRHQFRRQGSSYGPGQVHNMAVMVAPQKLDYSVTKGGLKTWAVLIVFVLLCSALLAIFSETDQSDEDNIYSIEEPDNQPIEQLEPEEEAIVEAQPLPRNIDDEDQLEDNEEEILFSTLREKAKEAATKKTIQQKSKSIVKDVEEQPEVDDEPEPRHIQRRKQRQTELEKKRIEEETERLKQQEVNEDTSEEDNNDSNEVGELNDDKSEESNDSHEGREVDDDSSEEEDEPEYPPTRPPIIKEQPKTPTTPVPTQPSKEIIDDDSNEDDDDDDDEYDSAEELILPRQLRTPRKSPSGISWHKSIQAQQMAQDEKNPRMALLKGKNRKIYPKLKEPLIDSTQQSTEEEEDEDVIDEDLVQSQITRDVVATRKRTNFYNRKAITNKQDFKHRSKLDSADFLLEKHDFDSGIGLYEEVIKEYKDSPRSHFGIGRANQLKSEFHASDQLIDLAISEYQQVLDNYETPDELFKITAENLIECARYRGNLHKVMTVQRELVDKFPEDLELQNQFGVTFLMMGRPEDARTIFNTVLETVPQNSVAQAYFGYLLKVYDQDFEKGVHYMRKGLRDRDEPIQDPKFYFHLGDGLMRLGRNQDAFKVYEEAVELGLFPSVYQRSTYNLDGLSARPWWTLSQTRCARHLKNIERQWTVFREEPKQANT